MTAPYPHRRAFLQRGLVASMLPAVMGWSRAWADDVTAPGDPGLLVRSAYPLDAETPVEVFDRFLTPNRLFFVRSHFGAPAVGLEPWRLAINGLVDHPLDLGLADLSQFEQVTLPAVLQCSGNGRANYRPIVPGVGWDRGAVGNAEWSGVRLADLLRRAGVQGEAAHIIMHGLDAPPHPKTPAYLRSLPITRALDPTTLLATAMNGDPLPLLHGGPLRMIVPGWSGNHWIKWVHRLTVDREEAPGFYQRTGYKIPKVPLPPGTDPKPDQVEPVTTLNVKSLIARPIAGATLAAGKITIKGVAWTGHGVVTRVEVRTNSTEPWRVATLVGEPTAGTWRQWTLDWDASPGSTTIEARATDSLGQIQPEITPWNKNGYLWNGIDRVAVTIR